MYSTIRQAVFAGDNFFRHSGEAPEVQKLQLFAWQAAARGNDVHLNANPTQGQILHHEFKQKKEKLKDTSKVSILARYGGEEYLEKAPKELLQGQTEDYVEYSRTGHVIKGRERAKAKSKYPEDGELPTCGVSEHVLISLLVFINNHTAVWGSWYDLSSGTWGYACCQSTLHISYCAGQAGIDAAQASSAQHLLASTSGSGPSSSALAIEKSSKSLAETHTEEDVRDRVEQNFSKKRIGEGDVKLDNDRLAKAIHEEKKRKMRGEEDRDRFTKRTKAGPEGSHDVTEEELGMYHLALIFHHGLIGFAEAYRINRRQTEDPMANYVDTND
jgi:pre-mRNA-processing factor SLU7